MNGQDPEETTGLPENERKHGEDAFYREIVRHESYARQEYRLKRITNTIIFACLVGGLALGFGFGLGTKMAASYWIPRMSDDSVELSRFSLSVAYRNEGDAPAFPYSYADMLAAVNPAVVRINVNNGILSGTYTQRAAGDTARSGTGMLFFETDNRYYIVTNAHVIGETDDVTVYIKDSAGMPAGVVGTDNGTDVAVISVDKTDAYNAGITSVSLITFGDSSAMRVGDMVFAIGNSLGDGNTATNGIVSALDRSITVDGNKFSVIQTNAAINNGNSGGPLLNLNGEVIGMNTAKPKLQDSGAEGVGYSIPSNTVAPSIERIMRGEAGEP